MHFFFNISITFFFHWTVIFQWIWIHLSHFITGFMSIYPDVQKHFVYSMGFEPAWTSLILIILRQILILLPVTNRFKNVFFRIIARTRRRWPRRASLLQHDCKLNVASTCIQIISGATTVRLPWPLTNPYPQYWPKFIW